MIPPPVPALLDPLVREFLDTALRPVTDRYPTPLHLVFPQVFARNAAALRAVLDERAVTSRICYAHKVNASAAFARTAGRIGLDIDIASPAELDSARRAGFPPERIEATGPKGEPFLRLLAGAGVTVNADNPWEVERLAALGGAAVPVLLRVSGFPGTGLSRFGFPLSELPAALARVAALRDRIRLRGFAFHLDTAEPRDRLRAIAACLPLFEAAWAHGLAPDVLDIGGGLRQVFTADPACHDAYLGALRRSLLGRGSPLAWGNATFGYRIADGAVHGTPVFHKYANTVAPAAALGGLLDAEIPGHDRSVAAVLADNLLELWLEPGKALADHAGITVAAVQFTRDLPGGALLVDLDISRDQVTPADQEALVDPLLVPAGGEPRREPVAAFLAGRLCLERDMVSNRAVRLPFRPRPGDLLVFPNTAGYHSDLSAAAAAQYPVPAKYAVTRGPDGFGTVPDAEHRPTEEDPCARTTASPT